MDEQMADRCSFLTHKELKGQVALLNDQNLPSPQMRGMHSESPSLEFPTGSHWLEYVGGGF